MKKYNDVGRFATAKSIMALPFVFFGAGFLNWCVGALTAFGSVLMMVMVLPKLLVLPGCGAYWLCFGVPVGVFLLSIIWFFRRTEYRDDFVPPFGYWWLTYGIAVVLAFMRPEETAIVGRASFVNSLIFFPWFALMMAYIPGILLSLLLRFIIRR